MKKKDSSSKRIKPLDDNLNEFFGPSQSQHSQETTDVTPVDTLKKSEKAKSKNDPDGSSHRRVDKSPQDSGGEDPSEPSSKSKQSAQQTMKPESEESSPSSHSSDDSESSDEKVPLKGKMKELPPTPPLKKRDRSRSPPHSRSRCSKSQSRSHSPKQKHD